MEKKKKTVRFNRVTFSKASFHQLPCEFTVCFKRKSRCDVVLGRIQREREESNIVCK